ncbi:hypothetical protein LCGC14_1370370 [marine sediment metagenome]|uniref:Uncharacterized protein n=1 Tax=marine sediment metagenome TaxID=412755 RepID=A0A0F9K5Z4_9ZZZZ
MTLYNSSFENGWTDIDGEIQQPNGWTIWYAEEDTQNPHDSTPGAVFRKPEMVHVLKHQLPPDEQDLFILDGITTFKMFKDSGSWYGGLSQVVMLDKGKYQFTANIFGDLIKGYDSDGKIWADDPQGRDGLFSFGIDDHWISEPRVIVPGEWNEFLEGWYDLEGVVKLDVAIMCPFPLDNAGIFADKFSLVRLEDPPEEKRGDPRVQYARTYYVFQQDAKWEDHSLLVKDLFEMRRTIGFSWDDAGIGNLDTRTAMMVALDDEQVATDWFDEYYKGVNVGFVKTPEPPPTKPAPAGLISLHRQTDEEGIEYFLNKVQPEWIKLVGSVENDAPKYKDWGAKNIDIRYYVHNSKPYIDTCDVQGYLANFDKSLETNIDYIDAVEDLNEENYADPKVIAFCIAMSNEIKRRYGDVVKLCSGNWPVGNGEGPALLEWARVIAENKHLAGYHPYHPVHPDWAEDWMETQAEWYHLRHLYHIDPYLVANGVQVEWLGTESGAVAGVPQGTRMRSLIAALFRKEKPIPGVARLDPGFIAAKKHLALVDANSVGPLDPTGGWKDSDALNGDLDRYIALQLRLEEKMQQWNQYSDNRNRGTTIFTVGSGFVGWPKYKLWKYEMEAFADALA